MCSHLLHPLERGKLRTPRPSEGQQGGGIWGGQHPGEGNTNMGAQQVRALCLLFATKQQIWGFDLKHNLLPSSLSSNLKKAALSQPSPRSNSSLVKWEACRTDSRIPDSNLRLTFICSFCLHFHYSLPELVLQPPVMKTCCS